MKKVFLLLPSCSHAQLAATLKRYERGSSMPNVEMMPVKKTTKKTSRRPSKKTTTKKTSTKKNKLLQHLALQQHNNNCCNNNQLPPFLPVQPAMQAQPLQVSLGAVLGGKL